MLIIVVKRLVAEFIKARLLVVRLVIYI